MEKVILKDETLDQVSGGTAIPYRVKPGDTLDAIAKKYNVTVADLMRWNNIQNPNIIAVDTVIKVLF